MSPSRRSQVSARTRVNLCAVVGAIAGGAVAFVAPWQFSALLGWDVVAAVLLGWIWSEIWPLDPTETRTRSTSEDSSHAAAVMVMVTASLISLVGMALGLAKARHVDQPMETLLTVFAVLTVVLSWCVVHTMYTLRYARLYYGDPVGGVDFHTEEPPDYHDFAYLSFTIGMAFAVSDTDLSARPIRRTATRHALLSYLFGAVIVGLTINVMAGFVR